MKGKAGDVIPFLGREGDFLGVEGRYMFFDGLYIYIWVHESRSIGGHICFVPSCMMVFASKMPTLRAFRALLKSFKKLGEVVSTSVWHHMQGLGPPDHVTDNKDKKIWEIYMFKNTGQLNNTVHMTGIQWHNFQSSIWGSIALKEHGRNPAKGSCD